MLGRDMYLAIAEENRRRILKVLRESGECGVGKIQGNLAISQGTLSAHFAILRKVGLVESRVNGRERIYRINWKKYYEFLTEFVWWFGEIDEKGSDIEIRVRK